MVGFLSLDGTVAATVAILMAEFTCIPTLLSVAVEAGAAAVLASAEGFGAQTVPADELGELFRFTLVPASIDPAADSGVGVFEPGAAFLLT